MLHLLKILSIVTVGAWSLVRGVEEAISIWVRRATRPRDLEGMAWA